jgi:hypothetical protein
LAQEFRRPEKIADRREKQPACPYLGRYSSE